MVSVYQLTTEAQRHGDDCKVPLCLYASVDNSFSGVNCFYQKYIFITSLRSLRPSRSTPVGPR
jgi:hypothetical protein